MAATCHVAFAETRAWSSITPRISDSFMTSSVLTVHNDLGAGPLTKQHPVAHLYLKRTHLSSCCRQVFLGRRRYPALDRFLLYGIRNDDAGGVFSSTSTRFSRTRSRNGRKCGFMISSSVCHVIGDDPGLLTADHPDKSWHLVGALLERHQQASEVSPLRRHARF